MSTFKSYIFHCAWSLKVSTSELDIAEITDNMPTFKTVKSFPFNSKSRSRNILVGSLFGSEKYYSMCRLSQANVSHKIHSLLLRLVQTLDK